VCTYEFNELHKTLALKKKLKLEVWTKDIYQIEVMMDNFGQFSLLELGLEIGQESLWRGLQVFEDILNIRLHYIGRE
jgi:hypothetical protein